MQIISDAHKDVATPVKNNGAYEWWYFDAIDRHTGYTLVVILYQGNPFSNRYIKQLKKDPEDEASGPENFPAVSISVYKDNEPVFYSFTEYPKDKTHFSSELPSVKIGQHSLRCEITDSKLSYFLSLHERLPSGDRIEAELSFASPNNNINIKFDGSDNRSLENKVGHSWNLVQPRAEVHGNVKLFHESNTRQDLSFTFSGTGYHDHNMGQEPMKSEFKDWYWGRFHFESSTLIYYVMNRRQTQQYQGWLVDNKDGRLVEKYQDIQLKDKARTIFGLHSARKIILESERSQIVIQQSALLDNGPFYQRFLSDAFLSQGSAGLQKSSGISEYIFPERIYWRPLWPLVDMRIRYKGEKPHWVQKSPRLYRWTW